MGETELVNGGDTTTLDVDALDAGTYDVRCTVDGHEDGGMHATLTVTDEDAASERVAAASHDEDNHTNSPKPDCLIK